MIDVVGERHEVTVEWTKRLVKSLECVRYQGGWQLPAFPVLVILPQSNGEARVEMWTRTNLG